MATRSPECPRTEPHGEHKITVGNGLQIICKGEHVDYPHEPGRLYDCPACEARCHCKRSETECIYEGEHNGLAKQEA